MRFRLRPGERSTKYRPGQFVSRAYAARYRHKVTSERKHAPPIPPPPPPPLPPPPPEEPESDVWEVTAPYGE